MDLTLSINCGFATNRYTEPEEWGKIVGQELGLHSAQIVADLINPFWDECYIDDLVMRTLDACKRYDFTVDSIFTSTYTRLNNLVHPDEQMRKIMLNWFKGMIKIGARLGATTAGSHFGSMTFASYNDISKREYITEQGIKAWQELSFFAKDLGYEYLVFEPMSIPREFANTIDDTRKLMDAVNANSAIPMKICLDVGHAPHPDERDAYLWLEALGADSPIIHLQQTEFNKSNHWPFTDECNQKGYILAPKVIQALEKSGCKKALMMFELSHREHWDTEWKVIEDHKASVNYWKQYVKV